MLVVSFTYACQLIEPMQVSESAKSFSLVQNATIPCLLYQLGRFTGKALISLNDQIRIYCQRRLFDNSLIDFLIADSYAELARR